MDLPHDIVEDIRRLDSLLRSQRTLPTKLEAVADLVRRSLPHCDSVSVSLIVEESMITGAATSQLAIAADLVQYRTGEGPCLTSGREQATIRIDALPHDEVFEHLAPGAVEMGIESVLSVPLGHDGHGVGSINLCSRQRSAFTDDDAVAISALAAYATDLIVESPLHEAGVATLGRLVETVRQASQVEVAVGMLIIREGMTPDEAWRHLQAEAPAHGSSIVDHAQSLIAEHERSTSADPSDDPRRPPGR